MRPQSINDDELLARLTAVFRQHGYEAASLSRISEATGLKRASLYHRFPGGKADMAAAVLAHVDAWFDENVFAPLRGEGSPQQRAQEMAEKLDSFYLRGKASCLFDTMTLGAEDSPMRQRISQSFADWLDALTALSVEAGLTKAEARKRAESALVRIQGSLVLARATSNARMFRDALKELPDLLTVP